MFFGMFCFQKKLDKNIPHRHTHTHTYGYQYETNQPRMNDPSIFNDYLFKNKKNKKKIENDEESKLKNK